MSWQGILAAILIVLAIFVARQMANAQPDKEVVEDRTTTTTKTEPCCPSSQKTITKPRPVRPLCCRDRVGCRPAACPPVRVRWPRPNRWCGPGWCRPWPRRHCEDWFEAHWERPPFDDWDDRW